jgi:hypothetical protein
MGLTLFALLAFGALTAASASATFLLAEWLVGGTAVSVELLVEVSGELLLEDTALKAMVLCSGILDGWVGPNSLDFVTEVLSLSGGVVSSTELVGTPILCEAQEGCSKTAETPNLWPLGLPWESELELLEQTGYTGFAILLTSKTAVGYYLECTILGIKSTDSCTTALAVAELTLSGTNAVGKFSEPFTELAGAKLATCSFAGGETGIVEGEGTYIVSGGGELTGSSEGVVS